MMLSISSLILTFHLLRPSFAAEIPSPQYNGPPAVAQIERSAWPFSIDSPAGFDRASRAEILSLVHSLETFEKGAINPQSLGLTEKSFSKESITLWKKNAFSILVKNFHRASSNCSPKKDITCPSSKIEISTIGNFSKFFFQKLPQNLAAWQKETQTFFDTYAKEQLRLAALFPKISSEILPLHPDEILGDKLKDRSFLLTFDDGPTEKEGSTDRLAQKLRDLGIHAFFFSLGSELEKRKQSNGWESLRDLYSSHCLASHGKIHSPHPKLSNWKESLDFTLLKIKEVQAQNPTKSKQIYFRPPFGQRTAEISAYSKENKSPVILWNIDTQDWNPMIRAEAAWGRLQKLMLVWRKGIVLFHDVHPKAEKILPSIEQFMQTNGLIFADCRDY